MAAMLIGLGEPVSSEIGLGAPISSEIGLGELLAGGEGIAAAILAHVMPGERFAFKLTCRNFAAAMAMHVGGCCTRTPFKLLVSLDRPALFEWALSMGAPWTPPPCSVVMHLSLSDGGEDVGANVYGPRLMPRIKAGLTTRKEFPRHTQPIQSTRPWAHARERLMGIAAASGSLGMLAWGRSHHCPWGTSTCAAAAAAGHLAVLEWLRDGDCPIGASALLAAAACGHAKVFEWVAIALVRERRAWPQPGELLLAAASGGSMRILRQIQLQVAAAPYEVQLQATETAAAAGHAEVLEWLRFTVNVAWGPRCWVAAGARGRVAVLDVLALGCPIARPTAYGASDADGAAAVAVAVAGVYEATASGGGVVARSSAEDAQASTALEWLRTSGLFALPPARKSPHDCATVRAAASGSVCCLEWLRSNGWALDVRASHAAAQMGHLAVLEHLHAAGVAFDERVWRVARDDSLRRWLVRHGCPCSASESDEGDAHAVGSLKDAGATSPHPAQTRATQREVELPAGDSEEERLLAMALVATSGTRQEG